MNFADFWKTYPHPKNRGPKGHAEKLYDKLTISEKTDMLAALPKYKAYLAADGQWQNAMQAQRWLGKKKKEWTAWLEAAEGEDADMSQIRRETEAIRERNERRHRLADEAWRDRYEKQFGHRPE